jgi:GNAT superfamily N-acetyltransferase
MDFRELQSGDEEAFEAFLAGHADSSMFLRGNARRGGLNYRAEPYQATYVAAFQAERLLGVAAHYWNGMLVLQAPGQAGPVAAACRSASGRRVGGLMGPADQVREARRDLGLANADTALDEDEVLYGLNLVDVVVPSALSDGAVVCRAPRDEERDTLCAWRLAYDIELLGATDSPGQRARSAAFLDAQIADGHAWVALAGPTMVSLSAFNAVLPEIVQLGGIYTPPDHRGRGYARAAVAHSLLVARDRGASRAVLFTSNPNAMRSYEAVGFRKVGSYALVLFR